MHTDVQTSNMRKIRNREKLRRIFILNDLAQSQINVRVRSMSGLDQRQSQINVRVRSMSGLDQCQG
jgi:hypothetical protein